MDQYLKLARRGSVVIPANTSTSFRLRDFADGPMVQALEEGFSVPVNCLYLPTGRPVAFMVDLSNCPEEVEAGFLQSFVEGLKAGDPPKDLSWLAEKKIGVNPKEV